MKRIFCCSIFLFFVTLIGLTSNVSAHTDITPLEAKDLIISNAQLIILDVRELSEYCDEVGHITGAVNYPWTSGVLQERYEEIPTDRDILVVCRSGHRSDEAADFLDSKGYQNVYDMEGGMVAWEWETEKCIDADGDGVADELDNCMEISNPNQEDADGDGFGDACDNNTTPCAVMAIYGEKSEETKLLRDFRDNVLRNSPEGRVIIRLYYGWSSTIVTVIENNENLKGHLKTMIDQILRYVH